jgi:cell division protein FtsQ
MNENELFNEPVIQKKNTPRRKKRLGLLVLFPLLFGVCMLEVLSIGWKEELKVRQVVVKGNRILSSAYLLSLASVPKNAALFGLNLYEVRQRVLTQPFVKAVAVSRQLPDKILIEVKERAPVASIMVGQTQYLDANGIVLPPVASQVPIDVPLISGIEGLQNLKIGEAVANEEVAEALQVVSSSRNIDTTMYHLISEINMNNGRDIVLYTSDAAIPVYLGRGDIDRKLYTLQNFWSTVMKSQDPAKLHYIDLRYNDQVIAKWLHDNDKDQTQPRQRSSIKKSGF